MKYNLSEDGMLINIDGVEYKALTDYNNEFTLAANELLYKYVITKGFIEALHTHSQTEGGLALNLFTEYNDNLTGLLALLFMADDEDIDEATFKAKVKLFKRLPVKVLSKAGVVIRNFFDSMRQ